MAWLDGINSDSNLHAQGFYDQFALASWGTPWAFSPVVWHLCTNVAFAPFVFAPTYAEWISGVGATSLRGHYLRGTNVRNNYPAGVTADPTSFLFTPEQVSASDLMPGWFYGGDATRPYVDLRDASIQQRFADALLSEVESVHAVTPAGFLALDNIVHPSEWGAYYLTWDQMKAFLVKVKAGCSALGVGLVPNISFKPGFFGIGDGYLEIPSFLDGVCCEMPFHPTHVIGGTVRGVDPTGSRLATELAFWGDWASAGKLGLMFPLRQAEIPGRALTNYLMCAAGVMLARPAGGALFVCPIGTFAEWDGAQHSTWWPTILGEPVEDAVQDPADPYVYSRAFKYGKLEADFEAETVTTTIKYLRKGATPGGDGSLLTPWASIAEMIAGTVDGDLEDMAVCVAGASVGKWEIDSGDWTETAPGSNLWVALITDFADEVNVLFFGATAGKQEANLVDVDAAFDWHFNAGTNVLTAYSVGNPTTTYATMEAYEAIAEKFAASNRINVTLRQWPGEYPAYIVFSDVENTGTIHKTAGWSGGFNVLDLSVARTDKASASPAAIRLGGIGTAASIEVTSDTHRSKRGVFLYNVTGAADISISGTHRKHSQYGVYVETASAGSFEIDAECEYVGSAFGDIGQFIYGVSGTAALSLLGSQDHCFWGTYINAVTGGAIAESGEQSYSTQHGLYVRTVSAGTITTSGSKNNNTQNGLYIRDISGSGTIVVEKAAVTVNVRDGIKVETVGSGLVTIKCGIVSGNSVGSTTYHGIELASTAVGVKVYRKTVAGNAGNGLTVSDSASTGLQLVGCILALNAGAQLSIANGAEAGALIAYNCFWAANAGDTLAVFKGVTYTRAQAANFFAALAAENPLSVGNICADPKFVDAAGGNFQLMSDSPCLGAGVAITGVTTDYAGNQIPGPNGVSMGAYESQDISRLAGAMFAPLCVVI